VKIAFDEHIPDGLVRVFDSLTAERKMRNLIGASGRGKEDGYTVVRSRDYNPSPGDVDYISKSDVPWLTRFVQDGGQFVISGNVRMMEVPQEVIALQQCGLIAFYFEAGWNRWDFFKKSSLLLWHWELVVDTIKKSKPGDVYRIPVSFTKPASLNLICRTGQLELLIDSPHSEKLLRKVRRKLTRKPSKKLQDELPLTPSGGA
jgi:hypothetical protein